MLVVAGSWELEAEEKTLYGEVAEAVLGALAPATIYQVRTFAENELGRSKEGRVVQVTLDILYWIKTYLNANRLSESPIYVVI